MRGWHQPQGRKPHPQPDSVAPGVGPKAKARDAGTISGTEIHSQTGQHWPPGLKAPVMSHKARAREAEMVLGPKATDREAGTGPEA